MDSLYYDPYYLGRDKFDEIKSEDFEAYLKCEAFHYFKKLSNSDFVDLSDVDEII